MGSFDKETGEKKKPKPVNTVFSFTEDDEPVVSPMAGKATSNTTIQTTISSEPNIKICPHFDNVLSKWKLFRDKFVAVAVSQKMVTLLGRI